MTQQLSNCCKAQVSVSSSDEGTSCFMCSECKRPCDVWWQGKILEGNLNWPTFIKMKEQVSVDDKLCCLCNDLLDATESKYCEICIATNKEQVRVDNEPDAIILGHDIASPDGDKSVVIIDLEHYERLKRLEEDCNNLEKIKEENKQLLNALKDIGEFNRLKRLDENVRRAIALGEVVSLEDLYE
jgi:hypothetical protein